MRWLCLLGIMASPLLAHAGQLPGDGVSAPDVAAALTHAGYPADVTTDRAGDPMIRSSTGKALFDIYFYDCGAALRCTSIAFTASFRRKAATPAEIMAWNRNHRFGRAFLDARGSASVAMDIEASRGMTDDALAADIGRWIRVLGDFAAAIGRE